MLLRSLRHTYIGFLENLRDPDYVGALVNAHRFKLENYEYIRDRDKPYFGPTTCNMATYACRVKKPIYVNSV